MNEKNNFLPCTYTSNMWLKDQIKKWECQKVTYLRLVDPAHLDVPVHSDTHQRPDTVNHEKVEHRPAYVRMENPKRVWVLNAGSQDQEAVCEEEENEDADIVHSLSKEVDSSGAAHGFFLPDDHREHIANETEDDKYRATVGACDVMHFLRRRHNVVFVTHFTPHHHHIHFLHQVWMVHHFCKGKLRRENKKIIEIE